MGAHQAMMIRARLKVWAKARAGGRRCGRGRSREARGCRFAPGTSARVDAAAISTMILRREDHPGGVVPDVGSVAAAAAAAGLGQRGPRSLEPWRARSP